MTTGGSFVVVNDEPCPDCASLEAKLRLLEGAERRAEQATRDHGRMAAELERTRVEASCLRVELAAAKEALRALEARVKRNARGKR